LLAADGLYASMWNRQREAEAAREKLAQVGDSTAAPAPADAADDDVKDDAKDDALVARMPLVTPNAAE
jgi:ATP-binding cassette, subfamily B, heavy metal transporter